MRNVASKNMFLKTVAFVVILGVPALVCLGLAYNILSPRGWAIGIIIWFCGIFLWAIAVKLLAKKTLTSEAEPTIALNDETRSRILREIRVRKAWIGILAVLIPIGIANGVAHRVWFPTLVGVGISLTWIYVTAQEIRRRQDRINLARDPN
jgi:hypothetical protein